MCARVRNICAFIKFVKLAKECGRERAGGDSHSEGDGEEVE